jgi:hypothetical protein
LVELNRRTALN